MRRLILAAIVAGVVSGAQAADMADIPILRGPVSDGGPRPVYWQGFYVGGQAGYGSADTNFRRTNDRLIGELVANPLVTQAFQLPTWPELGTSSNRNSNYGAFAGYNWQWDDVVLGIDASYLHGNLTGRASGDHTIVYSANGSVFTVTNHSEASVKLKDYGSLRLRAGYAIGSFLPYATVGFGLGQADIARNVSINALQRTGFVTTALPPVPNSSYLGGHFVYGYSAGLGVDVMLIGGLFARAEYEYQRVTSKVDINVNTVRGGLGYKF